MDIQDVIVIYGTSWKPFAHLTCRDVHPGGFPDYTSCLCGVCLAGGQAMERAIDRSKAPAPVEPEQQDPPRVGWWTVYALPPPDGLAGGVGRDGAPGTLTRKQKRALKAAS